MELLAGKSESGQGIDPRLLKQGLELNDTYRIDSFIGTGGMAEVYKGHNIQTGEAVAIKIVLPEFASDPLITELFRKEARILHHLLHDAIVRYYGFSFDAGIGRPYLATEFIEGPSLAMRMQSQPLTFRECDALRHRLADGLQKAHELGIIHRDLSPENIILPSGRMEIAKIIDFGIAKSADIGGRTLVGSNFAGKHNYVSPEQLGLYRGEVTPRSDVYSLGLTLAAAVIGTPLNMTGSLAELIEKRQMLPDLSALPVEMQPMLTEMLQPDPAKRLAAMSAVRDWVGGNQQPQPSRAPPAAGHTPPERVAAPVRKPVTLQPTPADRENTPARSAARLILIVLAAFLAIAAAGSAVWYVLKAPTTTETADVQGEDTIPPAPPSVDTLEFQKAPGKILGTWPEGDAQTLLVTISGHRWKLGSSPALTSDGKGRWTLKPDVSLGTGSLDIVVEATDKAGNTSRIGNKLAISAATANAGVANPNEKPEDFINDFGAGECFLAVRNGPASGDAITAFSGTPQAIDRFTSDFTRKFGQSPVLRQILLTSGQCQVLKLLRQIRTTSAQKPWLRLLSVSLENTRIDSTNPMAGSIGGLRQSSRYLLLVYADGTIRNVSGTLSLTDRGLNFTVEPPEGKSWPSGMHLLVALSTSVPSAPLERSSMLVIPADFESLLSDLEAPETEAAADIEAVVIE